MNKMILFQKISFKFKKHSPEILIVAGVVGVIGSTVLACKATTKISGILAETNNTVEKIKEYETDESMKDYTTTDAKKDLTITYVQTGLKIAKLYAPAVALGVISLGCIMKSHDILRKRNVALAAAYATIDTGFKEYRKRVVDRFGQEVDHQLKHNIKSETIEKVDEEGNTVTETIQVAGDPNEYSEYARFFDESCSAWEKDPEYNLMFLKAQQQYANDKLKAKGRLFLNEVYEMLGIPQTKAGQVVGWVYDPENPVGDNYVDFGIFDVNKRACREFVNGYERVILLDFNVDGNIWDLM